MPEDITEILRAVQIIDRNGVASVTFLAWDIMTTWDEEVALVWPLPSTYWIKWAYLWNRYFALAVQFVLMYQRIYVMDLRGTFSHQACLSWFRLRALIPPIQIACVQPLLIARLRALYNCNVVVTVVLSALYAVQIVNLVVISVTLLPRIPVDFSCFPSEADPIGDHYYTAIIVPPLVFESVMLALTIYKLVTVRRQGMSRRSTFLSTILRDGIWAFFLVFAIMITNEVLQVMSGVIGRVLVDWITTTVSFVSSRLILNMLNHASGWQRSPESSSNMRPSLQSPRRGSDSTHVHAAFTSHVEFDYELNTVAVDESRSRLPRGGERSFVM